MKKILILVEIIKLAFYIIAFSLFISIINNLAEAETKNTNLIVGASLKYDYKINTVARTTTANSQPIIFKTIIKDGYIEYYY